MKKRILIIVENLPVPFDRRVWEEATTLNEAGYHISVICPKGKGYIKKYEVIDGIHIYRHPLPLEAKGVLGYLLEYPTALFWELWLAWKVFFSHGFDAIHACNPPDTIVFVAMVFKLFGKKFIFDHHDINPELYEVKFKRRDFIYRVLLFLEKLTFRVADVSIATNESYKRIAIERGGMNPDCVYVVRSGPNLNKLKILDPDINLRNGRQYLVGYVGIMGSQDGIDILLQSIEILVIYYNRKDIHFMLIGTGTEFNAMKSYANDLGINEYVTFTGYLTGEKLLRALNSIDIGVCPDIKNDYNDKCTMNKIMEYMALAKPVVQFDLTEGRYSAQDASLYANANDINDLADKIVELIDNSELRKNLGKKGRDRIEKELNWNCEAPHLLKAYNKLFDS